MLLESEFIRKYFCKSRDDTFGLDHLPVIYYTGYICLSGQAVDQYAV